MATEGLVPDYDAYWKEIITVLFEDCVRFFLPEVHEQIDFAYPPEFLEQELHKLIADETKQGKIYNDKLAKVRFKDGAERWLLIHVEVQSYRETNFAERMFSYFYRIYDKYGPLLTTLAIYTGSERHPPDTFRYELFGTEVTYRFNTFSVRQAVEKDLLASDNPFALVVLAAKYVLRTRKDIQKRYSFKNKLFAVAIQKGYTRQKVIALLRFVHLILIMSKDLEIEFKTEFVKLLTNKKTMKLTERETMLADAVYEAVYGQSLEERDMQQQVVEKTNIARRLLKLRTLTIEQIAETTNLPMATIKSIQEDLTKE